ncbi:divalent cation tolerance protein CutA [Nonomuraea jiangxiensis]|uniref:Uncharacterized protein involved in tolerance to divalent cations n=1 Tax=Nonomuraea jiangxiensis TaxID=633440 RepID=A0A1G9KDF3_9ACTN|nr:divalent cation tolerance protein CutA [Nonomuraea jiangxiensis]SDL47464.1 Uncharacterized protein involved in tolerance to divalent cations [Nonomuraea jiangxiensis]
MVEFIEVHLTVDAPDKASRLAHGLLHAGLAATVDISEVTRLIRREGGIEETSAWQLGVVTTAGRLADIERHVGDDHPDEEILIVTMPISRLD